MSLSIAKDRAFARIYGTIVPTRLPAASYACWLGRDVASMYFFFTLPPIILAAFHRGLLAGLPSSSEAELNVKKTTMTTTKLPVGKEPLSLSSSPGHHNAAKDRLERAAGAAARFLSPVAAQFVTTPLHLLGLDAYNRRRATLPDRLTFVRFELPVALGARIARIVPAYSVGGVCNASVRRALTTTPPHSS